MTIDRLINLLLAIFGRTADGERRVYFHSQNLNEKRDGRVGWPWHGRCWLNTPIGTFRFSWNLWTNFCGVAADVEQEDGLTLHAALPPFSFWLGLPVPRRIHERFGWRGVVLFSLKVHDRALWWQFGGNNMEWSSTTPRWKHGCFHFDDFLLGQQKFSERVLSTHEVLIPMPEGPYQAKLKLEECEWKRPRWPWPIRRRTAQVEIPVGIPHQGKGENSWDCGEDALFGLSCEAWTVDEAISKTVASALKSRRKYDGDAMAAYPPPSTRQARASA